MYNGAGPMTCGIACLSRRRFSEQEADLSVRCRLDVEQTTGWRLQSCQKEH
jgi:hypothetical protein